MSRAVLTTFLALLMGSCASVGVRTEGVSGPVEWRATDLAVSLLATRNVYTFTLILKETRGVGITFTQAESRCYQPGASPSALYRSTGLWTLRSRGELRFPLSSYIYCSGGGMCRSWEVTNAPLCNIALSGLDDDGNPVQIAIELTLPANP